MKKIRRKMQQKAAVAVAMSMIMSMPAMASGWMQNEKGWWFGTNAANTTWHANGWQWIDGNNDGTAECYYFDQNGYMAANGKTPDGYQVNADGQWIVNGTIQKKSSGTSAAPNEQNGSWVQNGSRWQWKNNDGSFRKNGWHWLDGNRDGLAECYYFDANGLMIANGNTPDGYTVNADGAWVSDNKVQTKKLTAGGGPGGGTTSGSAGTISSGGGGGVSSSGSGGGSSSGGGSTSSSGGSSSNSISLESWSDSDWEGYSDNSVSGAANDFKNGNKGMMSDSQWEETQEAIEAFKDEYITSDMSDFEKEIKIVEWLVENCTYEKAEDWSRATAYSCIVLGKAQCSGYADAFLQTAKLCGLDVRYIYNRTHAWNLIKLDGDWYHVDVTWEDPIGNNTYGFGKLSNKYINLEDDEIRNVSSHHDWSPDSIKANGIKYGPSVVKNYMETGAVDTSLGVSYKDQTDAVFEKIENREGSAAISYTNVNDTADKIVSYLSERIDARRDNYEFLIRYRNAFSAAKTGDYSRLSKTIDQIEEIVNSKINEKYGNILNREMKLSLFIRSGSGKEYYNHESASLTYKAGQGLQVPYTIHYICNGQEVGVQTGNAEKNQYAALQIPESYAYVAMDSVLKGSATCNRNGIKVTGRNEVEINVKVSDTTMVGYTVNYYEYGKNTPMHTVTGEGKIGSSFTPEILAFDGMTAYTKPETYTLEANSAKNKYSIRYQKSCSYTIEYVCDTDGETLKTVTGTAACGSRLKIENLSFENHTKDSSKSTEYKLPDESSVTYIVHYSQNKKDAATGESVGTEKETEKNTEAETTAAVTEKAEAETEAVTEVTENAEEKTETAENAGAAAENTTAAVTETAGSDAAEQ